MNFEVLVEDSSGAALLGHLIPAILGPEKSAHVWRIHRYKGLGSLNRNSTSPNDVAKRQLLNRLPALLAGFDSTPGYDFIIVVVDSDTRDCRALLEELQSVVDERQLKIPVMFRLAVEEIEAWYFGDRKAISAAYPQAKVKELANYEQDKPCGTWELLLKATHPKSVRAMQQGGWIAAGTIKHEWANTIGPCMNIETNNSPSFCKLRDGLRRMTSV